MDRLCFGGQFRSNAFLKAYENRGHNVKCLGLSDADNGSNDVIINPDVAKVTDKFFFKNPLTFWRALPQTSSCFEVYRRIVSDFHPDVIQFEQPHLWPIVHRLTLEGLLKKTLIVYSSQNIEHEMQLEDDTFNGVFDPLKISELWHLEKQAAANSHLTIAVSDYDGNILREMGARNVITALNGCEDVSGSNQICLSPVVKTDSPYVLFVSSAHKPNYYGFVRLLKLMSEAGSSIPMVVAGSISSLLVNNNFLKSSIDLTLLGFVDRKLLRELYSNSAAVVVPKIAGGGSNLKTSEALHLGCRLISTPLGMRGFEPYIFQENVTVAELNKHFITILESVINNFTVFDKQYCSQRDLIWSNCLLKSIELIEQLARS